MRSILLVILTLGMVLIAQAASAVDSTKRTVHVDSQIRCEGGYVFVIFKTAGKLNSHQLIDGGNAVRCPYEELELAQAAYQAQKAITAKQKLVFLEQQALIERIDSEYIAVYEKQQVEFDVELAKAKAATIKMLAADKAAYSELKESKCKK